MGQTRLNWCMLLCVHNGTDALYLKQIGNKFVARNSSRQDIFEILRIKCMHFVPHSFAIYEFMFTIKH